MYIFSTFEHTMYLEMAISSLEKKGVTKEQILALPLHNRMDKRVLFDTIHRADGTSLIDLAFVFGTAFSVIGASVGYALEWGPIYWGLIGSGGGFLFGFLLDYFFTKYYGKIKKRLKGKNSEVILVIECNPNQSAEVEKLLWDHYALGISTLNQQN